MDPSTGSSRAVTIGSQASGRAMASQVNRASRADRVNRVNRASRDPDKGSKIRATKRRPADQSR